MRSIKFRVWNKKFKRWLTDNDSGTHCSSNWMLDIFTGKIVDFVDVDNEYYPEYEPEFYMLGRGIIPTSPFVVQQYTGLKDKNDKEIYEGDILNTKHLYNYPQSGEFYNVTIIKWVEDCKESFQHMKSGYTGIPHNYKTSSEVIGNIFETPELLK